MVQEDADDKARRFWGYTVLGTFIVVGLVIATITTSDIRGEKSAEERSQILSQCMALRVSPDTPQNVADKCRKIIREDELVQEQLEQDREQSVYQKILNY